MSEYKPGYTAGTSLPPGQDRFLVGRNGSWDDWRRVPGDACRNR